MKNIVSYIYGNEMSKDEESKINENVYNEQWNLSETKLLDWLQKTVNQMDLSREFSLGQAKEQCVCLDKKENKWEVYLVERGIIFDKSVHEELFDACIEVILQLSDSKELFEEKKASFCRIRNK